jgi:hypothetical protein
MLLLLLSLFSPAPLLGLRVAGGNEQAARIDFPIWPSYYVRMMRKYALNDDFAV